MRCEVVGFRLDGCRRSESSGTKHDNHCSRPRMQLCALDCYTVVHDVVQVTGNSEQQAGDVVARLGVLDAVVAGRVVVDRVSYRDQALLQKDSLHAGMRGRR